MLHKYLNHFFVLLSWTTVCSSSSRFFFEIFVFVLATNVVLLCFDDFGLTTRCVCTL